MSAEESLENPGRESHSARLAAQLLDAGERDLLDAISRAGLLGELDDAELLRIASEIQVDDPDARRLELLALYYDAAGEPEVARRRRCADRFFLQRVGAPATAASLVARLAELVPEVGAVLLDRVGGADGPLVLRAGEHYAAVLDDYEEETDTDKFDLAEADARRRGVAMVTVRGLVRAINVLLDRFDVRERLIALRGDDDREAYLALGITEAVALAEQGILEDEDPEALMDLAAW